MKITHIKTNEVIKNAIKMLGISVDAYATMIGVDRSTMYRYISSEVETPLTVLITLLDLVNDHGIDVMDAMDIKNEDNYYYHSTESEIKFPINVHINDGKNRDFGFGFYLGEKFRQSSTWGKNGKTKYIYRFNKGLFNDLSILDFTALKPIDWLNYVAINRKKMNYEKFPKLIKKYRILEKDKDLIKGKIADSFSYNVLELLFKDKIDIDQAEYATSIMALGNQFCLKNEEFATSLEAEELIIIDETISKYINHYSDIIQNKQNKNTELILEKPPKPDRLFSVYIKRKYE